jgi:glycosyltransferase involved in cell wall biosynthesis
MINETGVYCANFETYRCEGCIAKNGSIFGDVSVWMWRERSLRFLRGARALYAPNRDVKDRIQTFFPTLQITVRPHPEQIPNVLPAVIPRAKKSHLRVAVFGAVSTRKGSNVLLDMARDATIRRLPIKFILFGYSDRPELAEMESIDIMGSYTASSLPPIVARSKCHIAFFPAVWPETYSYTLSESYFAGLYPVAFDLGAIAERIRACEWGHLLPLELAHRAELINDELLQLNVPDRPVGWKPPVGIADFPGFLQSYYGREIAQIRRKASIGAGNPTDMRPHKAATE